MADPAPPAPPATADALRDWLRALKQQSGASFADIARAIGEEERTVKRWMPETGKPTVPSGDALLRLLDYFGVKIAPPPPREVALSLMGEIREVQEKIARLQEDEGSEERPTLPRIDQRLEELASLVTESLQLLKQQLPVQPAAQQQRPADHRSRAASTKRGRP